MITAADKNFLLTTTLSQRLYHECATNLPIIEFHNHLNISDSPSHGITFCQATFNVIGEEKTILDTQYLATFLQSAI